MKSLRIEHLQRQAMGTIYAQALLIFSLVICAAVAITIDSSTTLYFDDWKCHNDKVMGIAETVNIPASKSALAIPYAHKDGKDAYSYTGKIPASAESPGGIPYGQVSVTIDYYPHAPKTIGLVAVSWPFVSHHG